MKSLAVSLAFLAFTASAAEPPEPVAKKPFWSRGTFAHYVDGQPNLQVVDVTRDGDALFANLMLSNSTYEKRVPPPLTIQGMQLPDGSFWPDVTLGVSDNPKGPWESISPSRLDGKKTSVVIPPTLSLAPLRVDLRPFVAFFGRKAWARVSFANGDATVIEIKEMQD